MDNFRRDDLTIDDLIALLIAFKTEGMPPPPNLDIPRPLARRMKNYSSWREASIKGDVSISVDENEKVSGTVTFDFECPC